MTKKKGGKKQEQKISSVLNNQKPNRRYIPRILRFVIPIFVIVGLAGFALVATTNQFAPINSIKLHIIDSQNVVVINKKLSVFTTKLLLRNQTLDAVVKKIHSRFTFIRTVHIFKVENNRYTMRVSHKKPIAKIFVNKNIYLLSESGSIYTKEKYNSQGLPLVQGLSITLGQISYSKNSISLTNHQRPLVNEIIDLINECHSKSIWLKGVRYVAYRGFVLTLANTKIRAQMGRQPFASRIEKLQSIVIKLKKKGVVSAEIELDYSNKAFVKNQNINQAS